MRNWINQITCWCELRMRSGERRMRKRAVEEWKGVEKEEEEEKEKGRERGVSSALGGGERGVGGGGEEEKEGQ